MKVGDTIVCKHSHVFGNEEHQIRKRNSYIIDVIKYDNSGIWVTVKPWLNSYLVDKYFYTENELRKLKLEKINGRTYRRSR